MLNIVGGTPHAVRPHTFLGTELYTFFRSPDIINRESPCSLVFSIKVISEELSPDLQYGFWRGKGILNNTTHHFPYNIQQANLSPVVEVALLGRWYSITALILQHFSFPPPSEYASGYAKQDNLTKSSLE